MILRPEQVHDYSAIREINVQKAMRAPGSQGCILVDDSAYFTGISENRGC